MAIFIKFEENDITYNPLYIAYFIYKLHFYIVT